MIKAVRTRTTYANVTATLALFLALGGGAYAALGKNAIHAKQIAPGAVRSSEAKSLKPQDFAFALGGSQSFASATLNPPADTFMTIATDTINPSKAGVLLAAGTASVEDDGGVGGPSVLDYRLLVDGVPEDQTYTTTVAQSESAIDPAWFQCNEMPAGSHTVSLQVRADVADVSVTQRSLSLIVTPGI